MSVIPILLKAEEVNPILKERIIISSLIIDLFYRLTMYPLVNDSKLPEEITFNFTASFNLINFDNSDILKSIRSLNVIKVHGDDDILVTIITMCDESLIKPVALIFRDCITPCVYPDIWKNLTLFQCIKKV